MGSSSNGGSSYEHGWGDRVCGDDFDFRHDWECGDFGNFRD